MKNRKIISFIIVILSISILIIYFSSFYNYNKPKTYFGILDIPKIKVNNYIYYTNDLKNDVDKNVMLINDENDFIILAAHSGSSPISYFNKLHLLSLRDEIIFTINNRKRYYEIFLIEEQEKAGKLNIKKYNYPTIVLITCSKKNKMYQEIYYARLKMSEKIS